LSMTRLLPHLGAVLERKVSHRTSYFCSHLRGGAGGDGVCGPSKGGVRVLFFVLPHQALGIHWASYLLLFPPCLTVITCHSHPPLHLPGFT
jgi:hypothetical protein